MLREVPGDGPGQQVGEPRVDLHGDDLRTRLQQPEGQRAEAGSDLQHPGAGADAGEPDDAPHRVRVVYEVLAEPLRRREPEPLREAAHVGRAEESGHGEPSLGQRPAGARTRLEECGRCGSPTASG